LISKDREMVASGKMPTISPFLAASSATRNDSAPAARSTGMCFIPRMSGPATGFFQMESLAMKRTYRPAGFAPRPAKMKSM
jgi:hypothetical protein